MRLNLAVYASNEKEALVDTAACLWAARDSASDDLNK